MTLFNPYPVRVNDASGRPVSYALVYFYAAGTSDMLTVYADAALQVARTNPVVCGSDLSAGMLPPVYVDDSQALRVVWADADGATIYDADNIQAASPARTAIDDVIGASHAYSIADIGRITRRSHSGAMADTLPAAASAGNGAYFEVINDNTAGSLVVSVSGGGTIDGAASLTIQAGQRATFISDGTEYTLAIQPIGFGLHAVALPAGFWESRPTNGAAYNLRDMTTSNRRVREYLFDPASEEGIYGQFAAPYGWDGSAVSVQIRWAVAQAAGGTIRFGARGRVLGNAADVDAAYGSLATVDDASGGTGTGEGLELLSDWFDMTPAGLSGTDGGKTLQMEIVRPVFGTVVLDARVTEVVCRFRIARENDE